MRHQPKHDNFLADMVAPQGRKLTLNYWDGFRFGLGLITAHLLVAVVLGGLTSLAIFALGLTK